ncbi:hypothetical protein B0H16DRAFT_1728290 [Mycena metata]|uniref:Uncharacterized protein n=1 Tax=Mycena metata TaxID=1033252 RepID=A0AAD7IFQ6_9AGAR|nr:hypothetical protein B0H16DRAFT_1728290 [Mycena metata]
MTDTTVHAAFTSIIDHMTFCETNITEFRSSNLSNQHVLVTAVNQHCLRRLLAAQDVEPECANQLLLSLIDHCSKDEDHPRALAAIDSVFTAVSSGLPHQWRERFPKADIERREYARASAVIRRCPSTETTTYYVLFLTPFFKRRDGGRTDDPDPLHNQACVKAVGGTGVKQIETLVSNFHTAKILAEAGCAEWEWSEERIALLFEVARDLLTTCCEALPVDVDADLYLHLINTPVSGASGRVFLRVLRVVDAELLAQLKDWDGLSQIVTDVVTSGPLGVGTYDAIADILKISLWLRAICAIVLVRNTPANRPKAIGYVEQVSYPVEERDWLPDTLYNISFECLEASMLDEVNGGSNQPLLFADPSMAGRNEQKRSRKPTHLLARYNPD